MGQLAEQLATVAVEARSPDGNVRAWAHGRDVVGVEFAAGSYGCYSETVVVSQLEQLATRVWSRYKRAYVEVMDAYLDWPERDGESGVDAAFRERVEHLVAAGRSASAAVAARSVGLVRWEFAIAEGTLSRLDVDDFVAEVVGAVAATVADYRRQTIVLTAELYGPPPGHRAVAAAVR
jgi:hypothetical protein